MSFEKWAEELSVDASGNGTRVYPQTASERTADDDLPDIHWQALTDTSADVWRLRLYVSGDSPKSLAAFANLKRLCDTYLPARHKIEVVDLLEFPSLAHDEGIVAVPTLARLSPLPARTIIGDLSDLDEVLAGLQIRAKHP